MLRLIRRLSHRHPVSRRGLLLAGQLRPWFGVADSEAVMAAAIAAEAAAARNTGTAAAIDPFWAADWPSSMAIDRGFDDWIEFAYRHLNLPAPPLRILELGCGSGVAAVACALRGMSVTATDCSGEAMLLTRINAAANGVHVPVRRLDWSTDRWARGGWDIVLAADAVYDRSLFDALETCVRLALTRGGVALIAEPYRSSGDDWRELCRERGWTVREREIVVATNDEMIDSNAGKRIRLFYCTLA